jgi:hypothetical protein
VAPPVAVILAVAAGFVAVVSARLAWAWWKFRGKRVVTCPENERPAGVTVDAWHAAASSAFGVAELGLSDCSRWPEKAGCGQPCLSQIAAAPEDCLVGNILTRWYEGKVCALCGRAFSGVDWNAAKPALLPSSGVSVEWNQVPAEELPDTLAAAQPVCFACHMANTLVRTRPDLVVDRSLAGEGPRPA